MATSQNKARTCVPDEGGWERVWRVEGGEVKGEGGGLGAEGEDKGEGSTVVQELYLRPEKRAEYDQGDHDQRLRIAQARWVKVGTARARDDHDRP